MITTADNYILGVGYNGVPRGFPHCLDHPCPAATAPSGTALDQCKAVHAEINALLQCVDKDKAHTLYVTVSPCIGCAKAIANTNIKHIVTAAVYPQPEAMEFLDAAGITVEVIERDRTVQFLPVW